MTDTYTLQELLADADAYAAAGDPRSAAGVLFEGIDQFGSSAAAAQTLSLQTALGRLCHSLWLRQDFAAARELSALVLEESLKRMGGSADPEFLDIYAQALAATGTSPFPFQRLFRHQNLLRLFQDVPEAVSGDVAECGCARGLSFLELCFAQRRTHPGWDGEGFHAFDSFQGLSEPDREDRALDASQADAGQLAENMAAGNFAFSLELVASNVLRPFPRARLHPGWIPDCFASQEERRYRFVHVDVDLYRPTLDSLAYFYPRLADGGMIVTDDFNWPGASKAFREFCAAQGLELQLTDTTQAYLRKQTRPV